MKRIIDISEEDYDLIDNWGTRPYLINLIKNSTPLTEVEAEDYISREYLRKSMIEYGWSHPDSTVTEYVEGLPPVYPKSDAEDITFKDDNAVSRLSVRDIIYANAYELGYPDSSSEYVVNRDEVIKYLMELPSVYPKTSELIIENILLKKQLEMLNLDRECDKPSGKWIERDDGWGGTYYDCSACKESWTTIDGTPFDNGMKYCPHCGAKME